MEKSQNDQHLARERAVYDYLNALENGDIDGLIETLQQAVYDAPLDQMLVDAHQAYFQDGQSGQAEQTDANTRPDLPALTPLAPHVLRREQHTQRRGLSLWARTLAAVLIAALLIGGFVTILALYRTNSRQINIVSPPAVSRQTSVVSPPAVCKAIPWQISNTSISGVLSGIAASSPSDAWAVGQDIGGPLIEHWDGERWIEVSSPELHGKRGYLQAIAIVAPDDIWAAGEQYSIDAPPMAVQVSGSTTLIEHWDGKSWAIVASPDNVSVPNIATVLNKITVVSAHDIWIIGTRLNDSLHNNLYDIPTSLIQHWDGQQWTLVQDQGRILANGTQAIGSDLLTATSVDGQVLAAGEQIGGDRVHHAYLERWDGQKWQQVDVNSLGQHASTIVSLSAVSANDLWAIVQYNIYQPTFSVAIAHWDGKTWQQVPAPEWLIGKPGEYTRHILALSSKNVWAMTSFPTMLAHWDGKSWNQIKLPSTPDAGAFTADFTASAGAIWVVGGTIRKEGSQGSLSFPILEQQITCP